MKKQIAVVAVVGLALLGCSSNEVPEPGEADILGALTECAGGVCKDFKKTSCEKIVVDPAVPAQNQFKCKYSYVAAAGPKSEEKCFVRESGSWRVAACV